MLTTALNKSPKPPIIVDDIVVTELNLGTTPPQLEILEVGDLAVDRFRGIFKMQYSGDAFLTLKTRVQANPLNTYLSTKPSFASPQPLAAASGLTIPLQITLSDIRLSGFVILVFSRQKGITLVFRNDPLESLKVSSTFDSIPFVRDYLQKEIEGQLRVLFMEDLPAIIHRLSLRLWVPDLADGNRREAELNSNNIDHPQTDTADTFSPLTASDATLQASREAPVNASSMDGAADLSSIFLEGSENNASFSQKNLLHLAALNDSHRSLSLFTFPIRDAVFRAWAGAAERGVDTQNLGHLAGGAGSSVKSGSTFTLASLSRQQQLSPLNLHSSLPSHPSSDSQSIAHTSISAATRPSLTHAHTHSTLPSSTQSFSTLGTGAPSVRSRTRKRKHRIVNLRKDKNTSSNSVADGADHAGLSDIASVTGSTASDSHTSSPAPSVSMSAPTSGSAPACASSYTSYEREGEIITPPDSPERNKGKSTSPIQRQDMEDTTPKVQRDRLGAINAATQQTGQKLMALQETDVQDEEVTPMASRVLKPAQDTRSAWAAGLSTTGKAKARSVESTSPLAQATPMVPYGNSANPGGILEQAWMMKMASEIARKVQSEEQDRARRGSEPGLSGEREKMSGLGLEGNEEERAGTPPPAYSS